MTKDRFSKATVKETIQRHIAVENEGYDFDASRGWEQVEIAALRKAHSNGTRPSYEDRQEAHRAYGAFEALHALAEELGLAWREPKAAP